MSGRGRSPQEGLLGAYPLLSELYRASEGADPLRLRAFTTAAFADLLRTCPGLAAQLFGDVGPIPDRPVVLTGVPATTDAMLELVVEGDSGFQLLVENRLVAETEWFEERSEVRVPSYTDKYIAAARHRYG